MRFFYFVYHYLGKSLTVILLLFAVVVVLLIANLLIDERFNTLPITNYCFAIFAGISSICFSWARNIENKPNLRKEINDNGEKSLLTAIIFLAASILRYLTLNSSFHFQKNRWFDKIFIVLSKQLAFALFFISVILAGITLLRVFMVIMNSPKKDDIN